MLWCATAQASQQGTLILERLQDDNLKSAREDLRIQILILNTDVQIDVLKIME